jgi:formate/nitrite transporter FocA (FNT family)|tara:strand:+ start:259 stop:555 length:297 start_codon:yes stop_codon:yes gene_type:complete
MFLIPLGLLSGISVAEGAVGFGEAQEILRWTAESAPSDLVVATKLMSHNLAPVVAGNFIGATVFMSMLPYYTDWYTVGGGVQPGQPLELLDESKIETR